MGFMKAPVVYVVVAVAVGAAVAGVLFTTRTDPVTKCTEAVAKDWTAGVGWTGPCAGLTPEQQDRVSKAVADQVEP